MRMNNVDIDKGRPTCSNGMIDDACIPEPMWRHVDSMRMRALPEISIVFR